MTSSEPCARCGHDADFDIASLWLCVDCYHIAGSTCAGIGRVPAGSARSASPGSASPGAGGAGSASTDQVC